MTITSSNIFSSQATPKPLKVTNALAVSVSNKVNPRLIGDMSNDSIVIYPEIDCVHYLNGEPCTKDEVSDFDSSVLSTPRVLVNVLDFKQANDLFSSSYRNLADSDELMEDYLELEKVVNVITTNTKINLSDNNLGVALNIATIYAGVSRAESHAIFTDEKEVTEAVYHLLQKAEARGPENVYIYRNNSLVALAVAKSGNEIVVKSVRVIDL